MDTNSLSHTKWNCKYHVVFAPKYRRQVIYGKLRVEIGKILRQLCAYKGVEIIEAEACPDHIHMFVSIPPKISNLKYKYGNRKFWCEGYFVDTVGKNQKTIEKYIQNQLNEDIVMDKKTVKEYVDPFSHEPTNKKK